MTRFPSVLVRATRLAIVAALVGGSLVASAVPAAADSITVTTTSDADVDNGACSLPEAIRNAETDSTFGSSDCAAGGGSDTIGFSVTGTIRLGAQLPVISTTITIAGPGASHLTISGDTTGDGTQDVRVFETLAPASLTLRDITVADGRGTGNPRIAGAVMNRGTLTVTDAVLTNNFADRGGAIFNIGTVTIADSRFEDNAAVATVGGVGEGGAIWSEGALTLERSVVSRNRANFRGGGLFIDDGTLSVEDTLFRSNTVNGPGGAIFTNDGTRTVVTASTFADNVGAPGGAFLNSGRFKLLTSTATGNRSRGIQNAGRLEIRWSTLVDDRVGSGENRNAKEIYTKGFRTTISNSIVAGDPSDPTRNCFGRIIDEGYNLVSDDSCGSSGTSLSMTPPTLAPLGDHGGPTPTRPPFEDSAAIDAIPVGVAGCGTAVLVDQRGVPRPQGRGCDIGAVEGFVSP